MTQSEDAGDPVNLAIAEAVTALRLREGVTVDQLAVYAGLNRASLYRKLKGEVGWKATDVAALSRYFGVEPNDLFSRTPALTTPASTRTSTSGCAWSTRPWRRTRRTAPLTLRHLAAV